MELIDVRSNEPGVEDTTPNDVEQLVETPPFCNYIFNYYLTTNQVKKYT
jgi:hypothetical protein